MSLNDVVLALKRLTEHNDNIGNQSPPAEGEEQKRYFCVEDTILSNNIKVTIDGIGELKFPLSKATVQDILSKSQEDQNKGELMNSTDRYSQVVTRDKLKVKIDKQSLAGILKRMSSALCLNGDCKLVPNFYNMLVYGPGQFFEKHIVSEQVKNLIATIVFVLPSAYEGGDLVVKHGNKQHLLFGSQNPDFIKCIVYKVGCQNEIREITEGFCVAITYNVILESPTTNNIVKIDEDLFIAVESYFSTNPNTLVYLLNHTYTKNSLSWDLLKGTDRIHAFNLLAVGKKQNLGIYLAIIDIEEESDNVNFNIEFWVDELNLKFVESFHVPKYEICFTKKTPELFKPYKKTDTTEYREVVQSLHYQRGCFVFLPNKFVLFHELKSSIKNMHHLTLVQGNETLLLDLFSTNIDCSWPRKYWQHPFEVEKLLDIVTYIQNNKLTEKVVSKLGQTLLTHKYNKWLKQMEEQLDEKAWETIIDNWPKTPIKFISDSLQFIEQYSSTLDSSLVVEILLHKVVDYYIQSPKFVNNKQISEANQLCEIAKLCSINKMSLLENKLIRYIVSTPSIYTSKIIVDILINLQKSISSNMFSHYKSLRDITLDEISEQIFQLTDDLVGWHLPLTFQCECWLCGDLESFLLSKTNKRYQQIIPEQSKRHVNRQLTFLKDKDAPIEFFIANNCDLKTLFIEKDPDLLRKRQDKIIELNLMKKTLQDLEFPEFPEPEVKTVTTENENQLSTKIVLKKGSSYDKVEDICLRESLEHNNTKNIVPDEKLLKNFKEKSHEILPKGIDPGVGLLKINGSEEQIRLNGIDKETEYSDSGTSKNIKVEEALTKDRNQLKRNLVEVKSPKVRKIKKVKALYH